MLVMDSLNPALQMPLGIRLRADYYFVSSDLLVAADDFDIAEIFVVIKPVQINTYDFQNKTCGNLDGEDIRILSLMTTIAIVLVTFLQ